MAGLKPIRWIVGIGALAALGTVLWLATRPPPLTVQGEVSADRVDISPRVSGRIVSLGGDVGDTIERGAVIARLESPQLVATLESSRAALGVAKADLARVDSTRPETISARRADLAAAQADVTLSQESYKRQAELARSGNAAQQRVDEATRNLLSCQFLGLLLALRRPSPWSFSALYITWFRVHEGKPAYSLERKLV
jgi:HlyD family secretion protein